VLTRTTTPKIPECKNVVPSHLIGSNSEKSVASIFGVEVKTQAANFFETFCAFVAEQTASRPKNTGILISTNVVVMNPRSLIFQFFNPYPANVENMVSS
jgi:hypothetical protein